MRKILQQKVFDSQEKVLEVLRKQGFNVTQATVSRDMRQLKVSKVSDSQYGYRYVVSNNILPEDENPKSWTDGAREIMFSGNLAVIKTLPGYASSIATLIDNIKAPEILGTVAGDDTIIVVAQQGVPFEVLQGRLKTVIAPPSSRKKAKG